MPATWTDIQGPDPLLVISAGRSCFRVEDLLGLVALMAELETEGCK